MTTDTPARVETAPRDPSQETVDFGGLTIAFDDRVLRPRPWTLQQSLWSAHLLASLPPGPVLELCSGAGQIGLRALAESARRLVCVDADPVAAAYTLANAQAADLAHRVQVRNGRMGDVLGADESFVHILADPPWVTSAETSRYPEDPVSAIDGGDDGLAVVRECVTTIERHLAPGGVALLQLGTPAQAEAVGGLLTGDTLAVGERREYDGGVVLRLDRPE